MKDQYTILIADASGRYSCILRDFLAPAYHLVETCSPEELAAAFDRISPAIDLLLLCPIMTQNIAQIATARPGIPILALLDGEMCTCPPEDEHITDYLCAPLTPPVVLRRIQNILRLSELQKQKLQLEQESWRLRELACHDSLTGLYDTITAKKEIAQRLRTPGISALVIIDIDNFKLINDNYGHLFGNQVIMHLATQMKTSVRRTDVTARIGGDEFLIFLDHIESMELLRKKCAELLRNLSVPCRSFAYSVSMGAAISSPSCCSYDLLFHQADQALYQSKRNGKGQFAIYSES